MRRWTRGSTGAMPMLSRSRDCSRRASPSGSPARTPSGARSATGTWCSTTRRTGAPGCRSPTSRTAKRRSRSRTAPCPEIATLGFEYGFSTIAANALVVWEAQFGDFANVGQAIIGPEHSSARLERFLQLAAEGNIRVVNCTTPAQYFHALRWQALRATCRPLIVMTPKRLLRLPRARSSLADLTGGAFRPVLPDPHVAIESHRVNRVILCTGKVYFDPLAEPPAGRDIPILRVEQPYPFPAEDLAAVLAPYPRTAEICWVQEEPANMDAWAFMRPHLRELIAREPVYIGRPSAQARPRAISANTPAANSACSGPRSGCRAPDVLTPGAGYGKLLKLIIQRRVDVATVRGLTSSATDQ